MTVNQKMRMITSTATTTSMVQTGQRSFEKVRESVSLKRRPIGFDIFKAGVKLFLISMTALLTVSTQSSCDKRYSAYHKDQVTRSFSGSVLDYLSSRPDNFDSVLLALRISGLDQTLKLDTVTFFAPTDNSLKAAMESLNILRRSSGLSTWSIKDIDSSSWRSILSAYITRHRFTISDFIDQDGLMIRTVGLRDMHGSVIRENASGVAQGGVKTIEFSYPNGSRYTRDWLSTNVSTSDIDATNGCIDILENRHILGFSTFIDKAREKQNIYSEQRAYASGTVLLPNTDSRIWTHRVKQLKAFGKDTVQTEAMDSLANGYLMRLVIQKNDSIQVLPAPGAANQTITASGPCYFDQERLLMQLSYKFTKADGDYFIQETIQYTAR